MNKSHFPTTAMKGPDTEAPGKASCAAKAKTSETPVEDGKPSQVTKPGGEAPSLRSSDPAAQEVCTDKARAATGDTRDKNDQDKLGTLEDKVFMGMMGCFDSLNRTNSQHRRRARNNPQVPSSPPAARNSHVLPGMGIMDLPLVGKRDPWNR